jgi:ribosomal-protein-alanine N-acetyltransferase
MKAETLPRATAGHIQIFPVSWRDVPSLYRLEKKCFPVDSWPLIDIVFVVLLPNIIRLKASDQGRLIGFVFGERRRGIGWISSFGVDPDYRRRGVGTALLSHCEQVLGKKQVRLSVRATNKSAILLYERQGYKAVGTWRRYYRDGEDAVVMEKDLALI